MQKADLRCERGHEAEEAEAVQRRNRPELREDEEPRHRPDPREGEVGLVERREPVRFLIGEAHGRRRWVPRSGDRSLSCYFLKSVFRLGRREREQKSF